MIYTPWRYVIRHWQGTQGLVWSFWINLVLLRAVTFGLQEWLGPEPGQDFRDSWVFILILVLFVHGVVFVWQAVGVLRASEAHVSDYGAMAPVWGAQLGLVLAFIWIIVYVQNAWQMTIPVFDSSIIQSEMEAERTAKYNIEPSINQRVLTLSGSLELGITAHLKSKLIAYPDVEKIVLDSNGGNIYEARGLSNTIRQNGLNTLVISECSSACTTVFIGGVKRQLTAGAKLGFHQYRIDANYAVLNANPLLEQDRDRAVFLRSGVAVWFADKMFASPSSQMWYPELSELIEANVVTHQAP